MKARIMQPMVQTPGAVLSGMNFWAVKAMVKEERMTHCWMFGTHRDLLLGGKKYTGAARR